MSDDDFEGFGVDTLVEDTPVAAGSPLAGRLLAQGRRLTACMLRMAVGAAALAAMLALALATYVGFYCYYMPVLRHEVPLYFAFGSANPAATIHVGRHLQLRSGVAYDLVLDLSCPDIPSLPERLGNFMVTLEVTEGARVWHQAVRPALLPYRSAVVRLAVTAVKLVPLMLGWTEELVSHRIFLTESLLVGSAGAAAGLHVRIEIGTAQILLHHARLLVTAHLTGLRYYMYHWKLSCAVLAVGWLFLLQVSGALLLLLVRHLGRPAAAEPGAPNGCLRHPGLPEQLGDRLYKEMLIMHLPMSSDDELAPLVRRRPVPDDNRVPDGDSDC